MKTNTLIPAQTATTHPKYYEVDGALKANANKAWVLAFLTVPIALLAIGFAIFVRMQPPTVIRIGPNGERRPREELAMPRVPAPMSSSTRLSLSGSFRAISTTRLPMSMNAGPAA